MKTLSPGSHQPDLSTLFSCVLPQFSPFSCSPPTQRAFSGQDHSADLWSSVVAQLVSLICNVMQTLQPVYSHRVWNCDSKSSHGKTPIAFPHQMAQICHSSTLLLTLPNASSSCLVWVSTFLLTRKEASWERFLWQECVEGHTALGKHMLLERTFPWRFPAKFSFRFSQYWNEPQIISCRVQFPEIWAY